MPRNSLNTPPSSVNTRSPLAPQNNTSGRIYSRSVLHTEEKTNTFPGHAPDEIPGCCLIGIKLGHVTSTLTNCDTFRLYSAQQFPN